MKKVVAVFFFIIFLLHVSSAIALTPTPVIDITASPTAPPAGGLTPTPAPIAYELPYPGILPDNPLYPLKALRDRIISFLINDPLKKAEFNLLNSDKRLNAGASLIERKKHGLAVSTISKSNNYMHDAISKMNEAEELDKNVSSFKSKLKTSLKKHQQLILDLENGTGKEYVQELKTERQRLIEFEKLAE